MHVDRLLQALKASSSSLSRLHMRPRMHTGDMKSLQAESIFESKAIMEKILVNLLNKGEVNV